MRKAQVATLDERRNGGELIVDVSVRFPPDYFRPPVKAGRNAYGASAFIRYVACRDDTHWKITIKGRPSDVRDTIQSLRSAAPLCQEITDVNQRKWISFPTERAGKLGVDTDTFVWTGVDDAHPSSMDRLVTIFGAASNVKQACRKLVQCTATTLTCGGDVVPKHVARWIVGHNWSRAKKLETKFDVRFVKDHCESDVTKSVVKIIGTKEAVSKAYSELGLQPVKCLRYDFPVELGIWLTNHKDFRQRRIEDETDTIIVFEKNADTKEGETCCIVVGHQDNARAAGQRLGQLSLVIVGVRVQLSFNLGRFVVGDPKGNHPRRQKIEKDFNVTMHLERENQGRNYPSVMVVAGREDDVRNALEHLLQDGPLVEMCFEVEAPFYGHLVTKTASYENNFDKINRIGSSTQTQINVSNIGKYKCKCGDQERGVFEVSVAGPYKCVIEALRLIEALLPKPAGGPQPVQKVLRFRKGTLANIRSKKHAEFGVSSMPLATNGATTLLTPFVYPLTYWPDGTEIAMTDFVGRAYLDQCQRFGARYCRNCPVHYRELGGDDGYDQEPGADAGASSEADFAKLSSC